SLPFAEFTPAADDSIPSVGGNTRAAWEGTYPERPDISLRVEAAALDGRPVYFEVFAPWNQSARLRDVAQPPPPNLASSLVTAGFTLAGIVFAILLARRNLREGRGDRRGAWRLSIFLFVQSIVANVIAAHHTNDFLAEATLLQMVVG